jgi:hypothetical protein
MKVRSRGRVNKGGISFSPRRVKKAIPLSKLRNLPLRGVMIAGKVYKVRAKPFPKVSVSMFLHTLVRFLCRYQSFDSVVLYNIPLRCVFFWNRVDLERLAKVFVCESLLQQVKGQVVLVPDRLTPKFRMPKKGAVVTRRRTTLLTEEILNFPNRRQPTPKRLQTSQTSIALMNLFCQFGGKHISPRFRVVGF